MRHDSITRSVEPAVPPVMTFIPRFRAEAMLSTLEVGPPEWRVGFLQRAGQDGGIGNLVVAALMGKGEHGPGVAYDIQRLLEHLPVLF